MKKSLLLAGLAMAFMGSAMAHAPVIDITAPTASAPIPFPGTQNVAFTITHGSPGNLNGIGDIVLSFKKDGDPGFTDVNTVALSPFTASGTCDVSAVSGANCNRTSDTSANITIPWTVPGVGTYTLRVVAAHGSRDASDTEAGITAVAETVVLVEHPAMPAAVNQHINNVAPKLSGKARGCLLAAVAQEQAIWTRPSDRPFNLDEVQGAITSASGKCTQYNYSSLLQP